MATRQDARAALSYMQMRFSDSSIVGDKMRVIAQYLDDQAQAEYIAVLDDATPKLTGAAPTMVIVDEVAMDEHFKRLGDITREEVEKAHDFFKQWDNIKIVVSKITDERRARRQGPNISVSGTTEAGVAISRGRSE